MFTFIFQFLLVNLTPKVMPHTLLVDLENSQNRFIGISHYDMCMRNPLFWVQFLTLSYFFSHSGGSLTVNSGNSSNTSIGDNSAPNNPLTTTATTIVGAPTASTTTTTNTTSSQGGNQTTTTSINTSISSITSSSSSSSTTTNSTNNVGGTNKTSTPSPQSTPNLPPSMQENPQEN